MLVKQVSIYFYLFFLLVFSLQVMAIELLMACQALDLLQPLTTTVPLQEVHQLVRRTIPYVHLSLVNARHTFVLVLGIKIDLLHMTSNQLRI